MIKDNLQHVHDKITQTAKACDRDPNQIKLIAVSKTKPCSAIESALNAGQCAFGENYVQEGIEKVQYFRQLSLNIPIEWHFIGPLQSNKSKLVAEHFDWVQTVDRLKIAKRLNEQRPNSLLPLNILIQVNISNEQTKSGIMSDELLPLAHEIARLPNLKLRGLMAIPKAETAPNQQRIAFEQMFNLYSTLKKHYPIDTLSMGMSDDMTTAILAGSNMIRIGSAIFGMR
ncbi:YggS family pyridoxal phosphate-dependent enzyme [Orbus wheelerorum]|uniref:YggS family pyridoxal phosphate-dependent enzyme n=1 Tax=Orbus wheelerorum TaxID=3074111 RepID=UPI00370D686F